MLLLFSDQEGNNIMDRMLNMNTEAPALGGETEAGKKRYEKIRQYRDRLPGWWVGRAMAEVDREVPSTELRGHPAWQRIWGRPRSSTWDSLASMEQAQAAWDQFEAQNQRADEVRAEREAREADAQREREAADAAKRTQEAEALKGELKTRYLMLPGTNEADFETEYPQLLADHRRRELERIERDGDAASQAMRRMLRNTF